jgi:hypothetical protein
MEIIHVKNRLDGKQNLLIAGNNITIYGDTISSTGGGITQADLDTKQDVINDGDLNFAKTAGLVAAINAQDKLASRIYVDNEQNKKQDTLTAGTNITIFGNTISSSGGVTTHKTN